MAHEKSPSCDNNLNSDDPKAISSDQSKPMQSSMSRWRKRLWPVYTPDLMKLIPLLLMKLLLGLNYTLLYNAKETLIVTGSINGGPELIPLLKGGIVIPSAIALILLYAKASGRMNRANIFYATMAPFLIFIALFGYVLYPMKEHLTPHESAERLLAIVGENRSHWVAIYLNWYNSLFYTVSDLWGVVTISMLFWTFANQITSVKEAKRYYTLLSGAGDIGTMLAFPLMHLFASQTHFNITLRFTVNATLFFGLLTLAIYVVMDRYILPKRKELNWVEESKRPSGFKSKKKVTLKEGFSILFESTYLRHIAVMVASYSFALNMVEVCWKATLKQAYPSSVDYHHFMNLFSFLTGTTALLVTFFAAGMIIRKWGWYLSAQITPMIVGCGGILFFLLYYTQSLYAPLIAPLGISPITVIVMLGAAVGVLSKMAKYSFFDPTKEMAYIPLDDDHKTRGKAAVEVVSSRMGKSGSSWTQTLLLEVMKTNSILNISHFIGPIVCFVTVMWAKHVRALSKEFHALYPNEELEKLIEE